MRVYMPCYIHNFLSCIHFLTRGAHVTKTPLTCRSHQDHHQPRPADPEPAAAAAAVEAGRADTLGTHPEAALLAVVAVAAVAAAHCAQAWEVAVLNTRSSGSRATCAASAGLDRAFAAAVAAAAGHMARSHPQQRARRSSVCCRWATRIRRCRVLADFPS